MFAIFTPWDLQIWEWGCLPCTFLIFSVQSPHDFSLLALISLTITAVLSAPTLSTILNTLKLLPKLYVFYIFLLYIFLRVLNINLAKSDILVSFPAIIIKHPDKINIREKVFTCLSIPDYSASWWASHSCSNLKELVILIHSQEHRAMLVLCLHRCMFSAYTAQVPPTTKIDLAISIAMIKTSPYKHV